MTPTQTERSSPHTVKPIEVSAGILGGDRGHKEPQRPQHHLEPGGGVLPRPQGEGEGQSTEGERVNITDSGSKRNYRNYRQPFFAFGRRTC